MVAYFKHTIVLSKCMHSIMKFDGVRLAVVDCLLVYYCQEELMSPGNQSS